MILWHIYGYAVPLAILGALYGLRWKVGMWGNSLTLGALLFSALIAAGWGEDFAEFLAKQIPAMLFLADVVAFWTIFVVALLILDTATRNLSSVKVKYADMVENVGNGIALFLLFAALYGIFLFAEEIGPVGERHDASAPDDNSVAVQMLRIVSAGNLSGFTQTQQFDEKGNFRKRHFQRRQALMYNVVSKKGSLSADGAQVGKMKRE